MYVIHHIYVFRGVLSRTAILWGSVETLFSWHYTLLWMWQLTFHITSVRATIRRQNTGERQITSTLEILDFDTSNLIMETISIISRIPLKPQNTFTGCWACEGQTVSFRYCCRCSCQGENWRCNVRLCETKWKIWTEVHKCELYAMGLRVTVAVKRNLCSMQVNRFTKRFGKNFIIKRNRRLVSLVVFHIMTSTMARKLKYLWFQKKTCMMISQRKSRNLK